MSYAANGDACQAGSAEKSLTPFNFEGADVRVLARGGEPWFVLADVCRVLEHSNSRMAARALDEDEKGVSTVYTPGGQQDVTIINEGGLYSLILTSRKPEAKRFKKWVTAEVLPSIRKTGGYGSAQPAQTASASSIEQKLKIVAEARRTMGQPVAVGLWDALGLPMPSVTAHSAPAHAARAFGITRRSRGESDAAYISRVIASSKIIGRRDLIRKVRRSAYLIDQAICELIDSGNVAVEVHASSRGGHSSTFYRWIRVNECAI